MDTRSRLVIELDGGQHLANADAYRRDRRKDALLQEHTDFVLRFLVEGVGKRFDQVLDAIFRAIDLRSRAPTSRRMRHWLFRSMLETFPVFLARDVQRDGGESVGLGETDARITAALDALYERDDDASGKKGSRRGGLGQSAP